MLEVDGQTIYYNKSILYGVCIQPEQVQVGWLVGRLVDRLNMWVVSYRSPKVLGRMFLVGIDRFVSGRRATLNPGSFRFPLAGIRVRTMGDGWYVCVYI